MKLFGREVDPERVDDAITCILVVAIGGILFYMILLSGAI